MVGLMFICIVGVKFCSTQRASQFFQPW